MNWLIVVPLGWTLVAAVVALLIGRGILMGRGHEPQLPVGMRGASRPAEGSVPVTAPVDAVGPGADELGRAARTHQNSLAAAR